MKKVTILAILAIVLLASCQKERFEPQTPVLQEDAIDYPTTTQKTEFDRILQNESKTAMAKASRQMCSVVTVFIDYEGEAGIDGTPWGIPGTFNCPTSGMTAGKKDSATAMVTEDYSPFNVHITRSQQEFNAAAYPKVPVIVTRKNAATLASPILGPYPGVAYVSSILWNDNTPCFVFVNEFTGADRIKKIAEAISHELGHTFGLYHQGQPGSSPCVLDGEYRFASDDFALSAIMGNPYQGRTSRWITGPSVSLPCETAQNDAEKIASITGYKNESFGSSFTGAPTLSTNWLSGVLVNVNSQHAFRKTTAGTKTLKVISAGNLNVKVAVYNSPTSTTPVIYDDPNSLNVTVTLSGQKWIRVFTDQPADFAPSSVGGGYKVRLQ